MFTQIDKFGGFSDNWLNFKVHISIVDKSGKEQTSSTTEIEQEQTTQNARCIQSYEKINQTTNHKL